MTAVISLPAVFLAVVAAIPTVLGWLALLSLVIVPAAHFIIYPHARSVVFGIKRVNVNAPVAVVSAYLRTVANLPTYEQKVVASLLVGPVNGGGKAGAAVAPWSPNAQRVGGSAHGALRSPPAPRIKYTLFGFWVGLPWRATFTMTPTRDGGFHSALAPLSPSYTGAVAVLLGITGGFVLGPRRDGVPGTRIVHYERYEWPAAYPLLLWGARWVRQWHEEGMEVEMGVLQREVEAAAAAAAGAAVAEGQGGGLVAPSQSPPTSGGWLGTALRRVTGVPLHFAK
ncbi:hypothetical protein I4F81_004122 [Pyropia yezoensis]|uniref:Uncharacterized protein n=1 Tax=Pyropia yezoensis TaxID=2788 RepID=A0ACC3BV94_PYRYE|nr:hypothetical protein I4F81_004122 [Neopyropia yezoensis]